MTQEALKPAVSPKSKPESDESKEERLARITARQAIAVTAITVLGGLAGAGFQYLATSSNSKEVKPAVTVVPKQRWLVLKGVELANFADSSETSEIRLVTTINGDVAVSYPTPTIWEPVASNMPEERFPLPIGADSYKVTFEMFVRNDPGPPVTFHSQEPKVASSFPFESEVKLVYFTPASRATAPTERRARVHFSIEE